MMLKIVRGIVVLISLALAGRGLAQDDQYVRVQDSPDANHRLLQVAIRTFEPADGKGPPVHLVGAVHVGDLRYYHALQEFLDSQSLVLYEGVKPEGMGGLEGDDASRARVTASRQRMLAILAAEHRRRVGTMPATVEEILAGMEGTTKIAAKAASLDGWGNPQHLVTEGGFDVVSYGADGRKGGEGAARDIRFTEQKPLTKKEVDSAGEGIQTQLAEALGLEFQLKAIDYSHPTWRNSDLSIDEVQKRLDEKGAGDALLQMLDGSSMMAQMGGAILKMIGRSDEMSFMAKLMMIEALAHSDAMMKAQDGAMAGMMEVIILDRNSAVLADLRRALDEGGEEKGIALFYGAGHLPNLEQRLESEFGYRFASSRWLTAVDVDLNSIPGGKAQARQLRQMMDEMSRQAR